MRYEDQLYVWCLLAGKIAPAHPCDRRPTEYALLVPDALAVAEVNAMLDTPITVAHLPAILKHFKHLDPPFDRGNAAPASAYGYVLVNGVPRWNNGHLSRTETAAPDDHRKVYKREWMRRARATAKALRESCRAGSQKNTRRQESTDNLIKLPSRT